MVESKTVAGVISMQEITEQKKKRYEIAKELFTDLLNPENPGEVQRELEEKIKLCEEKIEQTSDVRHLDQEKQPPYARMWNSKSKSEEELINEQQFNELANNKKDYKIFIIDEGEYEMGSIGEVYFNNNLVSPHSENIKEANNNQEKKWLTSLEYRILFHTLKHKGMAGDIFTLTEKCWFQPNLARDRRSDWQKVLKGQGDRDTFRENTSGFRKAMSVLSTFLQNEIKVQLRTFKTGKYRLSKITKYCIVRII